MGGAARAKEGEVRERRRDARDDNSKEHGGAGAESRDSVFATLNTAWH